MLSVFVLGMLGSCSHYTQYWHGEEDDVYFTSQTPEEVKVHPVYQAEKEEENRWRTVTERRRTYENDRQWERDRDYRYRRNRTYYPPVRRSGGSDNGSNSGKTTSPEPKKSPTPTRETRPSKSKTPTPQ